MNIIKKLFFPNKKIWYPQNDEEFNYIYYYYNINSTHKIIKPEDKYPHEGIDNDEYLLKKIKEL